LHAARICSSDAATEKVTSVKVTHALSTGTGSTSCRAKPQLGRCLYVRTAFYSQV
jgi:hypothetical protein